MKNFAISLCVLLFLAPATILSQEITEPAKDKPVLYINTNVSWAIGEVTKSFSDFIALAEAEGFEVDHGYLNRITDSFLEGIDVLMIYSPGNYFLDSDKAAIRRFLRGGGSLLMIPAHSWFFDDLSNIGSLIEEYGIGIGPEHYNSNILGNVPADCPMAGPEKCKKVELRHSRVCLVVDKKYARSVIDLTDGQIGGAICTNPKRIGKGKLVVLGNSLQSYQYQDNRAFNINMLKYLYGSFDINVLLTKVKGRRRSLYRTFNYT